MRSKDGAKLSLDFMFGVRIVEREVEARAGFGMIAFEEAVMLVVRFKLMFWILFVIHYFIIVKKGVKRC